MLIRARAPLRLGLAGGGSDVSPFCDEFGGNVLNATIGRYAYAFIRPLKENLVRFIASDQQITVEQSLDDELELNGQLNLHKAVYDEIITRFNNGKPIPLEITTYCDAPAGSGLGSSSTIVVAMIKAFVELLNLPLDDYEIARTAFYIERIKCGLEGGRQDQYSATFGGFNFMEFYGNDRVVVNSLRIKNWISAELEAALLLFYTGVSRESAKIISNQSTNMKSGDNAAFHKIKQEAVQMKECLLKGDFEGIVSSMREGWESKKKSAESVSNASIDQIHASAIQAGALAGKVSGAGGGGFMMFFVQPHKRMEVIRTLSNFGGQIGNANFVTHGTQAWKIT